MTSALGRLSVRADSQGGEGRRCKGGDENPKNVSCISIGEKQTSLNLYIIQFPYHAVH